MSNSQSDDSAYWKVAKERADKIVATLNLKDLSKSTYLGNLIAGEYVHIKSIDAQRDSAIKQIKLQNLSKDSLNAVLKRIDLNSEKSRDSLNKSFIDKLQARLNKEQVDKVKDGLTYNVLPITYKAYLEMIPRLTKDEKKFIYDALVDAREHAMAAGSSKVKHGWFGKYKGKINNYLSSRGYDLNKEEKAWKERTKVKSNEGH